MNKVNVPDLASNATAYELEDGRIFRVHMNLITPVDQLATSDYVEVETHGYQIDKSGAFVVDENDEPITLPSQRARIPLANVRAGTDSVKAGWQKQSIPSEEENPEGYAAAIEGARKLKKLPKTGDDGEKVLVDGDLYAYGEGLYEQVRRQRVEQVPQQTPEASLTDEQINALIP